MCLYCICVLDLVEVLAQEIIVSKVEVVRDLQEVVEVGIQEVTEVMVVVEDIQVICCVETCYPMENYKILFHSSVFTFTCDMVLYWYYIWKYVVSELSDHMAS